MSAIKAQQIQDYLAQFSELPNAPEMPEPTAKKWTAENTEATIAAVTASVRTMQAFAGILKAIPYDTMRPKLQRSLNELMALLVGIPDIAPSPQYGAIILVIERGRETLAPIAADSKVGKKEQAELADALAEIVAELTALGVPPYRDALDILS